MTDPTSLFNAIKQGDVATVTALLETTPAWLDQPDANALSPLMTAVYYRQQAVVDLLLARGASLDLWAAAALGDQARVAAWLEEQPASLNDPAPDGFTPLGLAIFFDRRDVARDLLARGADVNRAAANAMRVAPIHSAAAQRDPDAALALTRLLLEHDATVNVAQHGGWTPLHQAAAHGQQALTQLLLAHGADASAASEDGRLPADMAAENGHDAVAALLAGRPQEGA